MVPYQKKFYRSHFGSRQGPGSTGTAAGVILVVSHVTMDPAAAPAAGHHGEIRCPVCRREAQGYVPLPVEDPEEVSYCPVCIRTRAEVEEAGRLACNHPICEYCFSGILGRTNGEGAPPTPPPPPRNPRWRGLNTGIPLPPIVVDDTHCFWVLAPNAYQMWALIVMTTGEFYKGRTRPPPPTDQHQQPRWVTRGGYWGCEAVQGDWGAPRLPRDWEAPPPPPPLPPAPPLPPWHGVNTGVPLPPIVVEDHEFCWVYGPYALHMWALIDVATGEFYRGETQPPGPSAQHHPPRWVRGRSYWGCWAIPGDWD